MNPLSRQQGCKAEGTNVDYISGLESVWAKPKPSLVKNQWEIKCLSRHKALQVKPCPSNCLGHRYSVRPWFDSINRLVAAIDKTSTLLSVISARVTAANRSRCERIFKKSDVNSSDWSHPASRNIIMRESRSEIVDAVLWLCLCYVMFNFCRKLSSYGFGGSPQQ